MSPSESPLPTFSLILKKKVITQIIEETSYLEINASLVEYITKQPT